MVLLILDWSAISKLLKHFFVHITKIKKDTEYYIQNVKFRQTVNKPFGLCIPTDGELSNRLLLSL